MNPVVLYYSRSGNTAKLAKRIQTSFHCDTIRIEPEEAYGNYIIACLRVMQDSVTKQTPAFLTPIPDLKLYDPIFIGYPVWAQDVPAFVAAFLQQCNLKGKTVIPFATYGMTGIQWTMKTLEKVCCGAQIRLPFDQGLLKKGNFSRWEANVKVWIDSEQKRDVKSRSLQTGTAGKTSDPV